MSGEPKAFASLSSGLLARKGAARPAMRPQGFGQIGGTLEDLGWNDMGFEPPRPAVAPRDEAHDGFGEEVAPQPLRNPLAALTPVQSPVHDQQAEIAGRLAPPSDLSEDGEEEIDDTAELYDPEPEAVDVPEVETAADPVPEAAPAAVAQVAQVTPFPVRDFAPVAAPAARRVRAPRAAPGSKAKAAFTLRLDPDRHLKLRLACAVTGRSAQQLVTDAVDQLLEGMPELDAMAEKARRKE